MEGIVLPLKPFPKCLEGQDHASDVRVRPEAARRFGEVIEEVAPIIHPAAYMVQKSH